MEVLETSLVERCLERYRRNGEQLYLDVAKYLMEQYREEARRQARIQRRQAKREARQLILEAAKNGGFYPTVPPETLWGLGFDNGQLRRLADGLVKKGLLVKHVNTEYASEKGREIGTVFYTVKET